MWYTLFVLKGNLKDVGVAQSGSAWFRVLQHASLKAVAAGSCWTGHHHFSTQCEAPLTLLQSMWPRSGIDTPPPGRAPHEQQQ